MTQEQKILLLLIRKSLGNDKEGEEKICDPAGVDWGELITLASKQWVLGVSHDGLVKWKKSSAIRKYDSAPKLSKELHIRWELNILKLETKNKRQREVIKELVTIFLENGIETLLLKGVGLGVNYPQSNHRDCSDIDIYLFGDFEKGNRVIEKMGIEVERNSSKHSIFYIKGTPIENHKTFLDIENSHTDNNFELHLHKVLEEQGFDTIMIDDIPVRVPTPDFTASFLCRHSITQFLASGLVFRHFCDIALFFEKNSRRIDFASFEKIMKAERQYYIFCSFIDLAQTHLGMSRDKIQICPAKVSKIEALSNRVLEDTLLNKFRSIDRNYLEKMWAPRRNLLRLKLFLASKWKYDIIDKRLFYKVFLQRFFSNFH